MSSEIFALVITLIGLGGAFLIFIIGYSIGKEEGRWDNFLKHNCQVNNERQKVLNAVEELKKKLGS